MRSPCILSRASARIIGIIITLLVPLSLAAQSTDFAPSIYLPYTGYHAILMAELSEGKIISEAAPSTIFSIQFHERNYATPVVIHQPIFLHLGIQLQQQHSPFKHWQLIIYDAAMLRQLGNMNLSFETEDHEFWVRKLITGLGLTVLDLDRTGLPSLNTNWLSVSAHTSLSFINDPMLICGTPMKGAPRIRIPEYFIESSLEAGLTTLRLGSEHYTGVVPHPDEAIVRPTVQASVNLGAGLKEILQFLVTASTRYFFTRDNLLLTSIAGQFYWSIDEDWPQFMLSIGREYAFSSIGSKAYTSARLGLSIKIHQLPFE